MGEIMRPLPFATLMEHALGEHGSTGSVFGIREEKFYRNRSNSSFVRFGQRMDSPIGPAAGPNSQLAENIVAAYLAGSRFIELKTVQTMDGEELRNCVSRPCINAADECYNVEWSTELTVQQAFDEYVKAWFAAHVLGREFDLGCNVVFNMSVGYSLEGIQSKKIDDYIEGMKDASGTAVWRECVAWLTENLGRFKTFSAADLESIPTAVSTSITLSTLHGCPREEIERIAHYLLTEKRISTCVKCNPTLLGYQDARRIMDSMGYDYVSFGELHFNEDLQYDDAVGMIGRLKETASGLGLEFGVKITNTFPVDITRGELPGEEMYMSGRSLFALSLTVASRLANAFKGELVISYSGGADAFNLVELLAVGIGPVTVATTVLKPGGYERMRQLAELAEPLLEAGAEATVRPGAIDAERLLETAENVAGIVRHRKEYREGLGAGTTATVPLALTDCGAAPCSQSGCPINQQIPAYLEQVGKGNMERAFAIIANDNVLPSITGTICDHNCQNNCTRLDYDDSLQIRSAKKVASLAAQKDFVAQTKAPQLASDAHVLVIGAGPAGLAAAAYLRRNGVRVTVRESRQQAGGIVSHVIPAFRIDDSEIGLDVALAAAWGVEVQLGADPDFDLGALKGSFDYVVVATGAWKEGRGPLPLDGTTVIDALDFLGRSRASGCTLDLGARVAVIGGGDVAMDCARAAARNAGVEEAVVVYRRTRAQMPAQREEIELALKDGVRVLELCSPDTFVRGLLTCEKMRLGALDASGRRGIEGTGTFEVLSFDTVISAVGAQVDTAAFAAAGLATDARGLAVVNDANESSMSGVYVAGDCKAGPKTVVAAMADAKAIAKDILAKLGIVPDFEDFVPEACRSELIAKKGVLAAAVRPTDLPAGDSPEALKLDTAAQLDSLRCLACDVVCEVCADVCPNRANVVIDCADAAGAARAPLVRRYQILHLDGLCNECGNCGVFCPTSGNPYLDKLTLFATDEDFADSKNKGFLPLDADASRFKARLEDGSVVEAALGDGTLPGAYEAVLASVMSSCRYLLRS